MEIYVNDTTRTLAISSNDYVLLLTNDTPHSESPNSSSNNNHHHHHHLHHRSSNSTSTNNPQEIDQQVQSQIEFVPRSSISLNSFHRVQTQVYGFLGIIALKGTIYAGFITNEQHIGPVVPNVDVCRLISTMFINFKGEVFNITPNLYFDDSSSESIDTPITSSKITSIMKLLETGSFYYSHETDLATKAQDWDWNANGDPNPNANFNANYTSIEDLQDDYAGRFVWNNNLISELSIFRNRLSDEERRVFDCGKFYITLIRGFVKSSKCDNSSTSSTITIITRQDSRKNGYLFGPVCMDEEGNVANFAETEIIVHSDTNVVSYSLVKGNAPLFWKLDSHLMSTKIEFPRSSDASKHAFNRFFETLCSEYNMVYALDALSNKGSQTEISNRYFNVLNQLQCEHPELPIEYKKLTNLRTLSDKLMGKSDYYNIQLHDESIYTALEDYFSFQYDIIEKRQISRQLGTFFITTLDSNEKSNIIECTLSIMIIEHIFGSEFSNSISLIHGSLWESNGYAIGKLSESYNNSIKTINKSGGIIGKVAEQGKKYAGQSKKYVSNNGISKNLTSSGRQHQLDKLLGKKNKEVQVKLFDPIHDYVLDGLNNRRNEFITSKNLLIYNVTFNVASLMHDGDLSDLVYPEPENFNNYDIIAIALEEVIELTPSKVKSIDIKSRNFWEKKLKETIDSRSEIEYTLLRGEQLGGVLLLVYVNTEISESIKNVETCVKKTGFKGISANKGAVGITFTFSRHSRLCFVASHLAAGQSHSEERHKNFKTVFKGLKFKKCKNITDSDILFWMGDLNFRISLPSETVRKFLKHDDAVTAAASHGVGVAGYGTKNDNMSYESIASVASECNSKQEGTGSDDTERKLEEENYLELMNTLKLESRSRTTADEDTVDENITLRVPEMPTSSALRSSRSNSQIEIGDETASLAFSKSNDLFSTPSLESSEERDRRDKRIAHLFEYDQLNYQMSNGKSFPFFDEMEIHFNPTYKFDKGTNQYDTSEKQRVPSWTDRILTHCKNKRATELEPLRYNSIPQVMFSDHKPVYGIFRTRLDIVNDAAKNKMEKQLYEMAKQKIYADRSVDYDKEGEFEPITANNRYVSCSRSNTGVEDTLPEPSSKDLRWWVINELGINGRTKIRFSELENNEFIVNPKYPKNPFVKTDEPKFIKNLSN